MRDTIRKSANRYSSKSNRTTRANDATSHMAASNLEAADALKHNRCPTCAGPVRSNLALTGWVQCAQFGAVGFRADANRPACNWQGFTE